MGLIKRYQIFVNKILLFYVRDYRINIRVKNLCSQKRLEMKELFSLSKNNLCWRLL